MSVLCRPLPFFCFSYARPDALFIRTHLFNGGIELLLVARQFSYAGNDAGAGLFLCGKLRRYSRQPFMLFDLVCTKSFKFIIETLLFTRETRAFLFNLLTRCVQLNQPRLR